MSIPAEERQSNRENESSTGLKPNVAALLAYLGLWVTGIVFLIIEQKNRSVRFHAAQSFVSFGGLSLLHYWLSNLPVVGWAFAVIAGVFGLVLWIVLMSRAYRGEHFKLPVAGVLAERLIGASPVCQPGPPPPAEPPVQTNEGWYEHKAAKPPKPERFRDSRAARITASAFAIAWGFVLLIFFNFFNQYIAYYHMQNVNGVDVQVRQPLLTSTFESWLAMLTVALVIGIVGHTMLILVDRYILREATLLVLDLFGIAVIAMLLSLFPFDFSVIPNARLADITAISVQIVLGLILLGFGIGVLVRFIKLTVNLARGTRPY